jgi:membrane protein YqaA with SNARE-associated domain
MISSKLHQRIKRYVAILQTYADRLWYPPLIAFLAALDNIVIVIPNDGILISSSMLTPKRWFWLALSVTIGSTIGAMALATLIEIQGLPWLLDFYPGVDQTDTWRVTNDFFQVYGLIIVFIVAASPLMQQPAVILASLADTPLPKLAAVVFVGRFIKFLIMAYVGSHAPRLLERMWGLKGELDDVGVQVKK